MWAGVCAFGQRHIETGAMLPHPGQILVPRGRIDHRTESPGPEKVDDQVIDDPARVVQHAGVECTTRRFQLGNVIGQQILQIPQRAGTLEIDNRHVRDIKHTGIATDGMMLIDLRPVMQRHVPATEIDNARIGGDVTFI